MARYLFTNRQPLQITVSEKRYESEKKKMAEIYFTLPFFSVYLFLSNHAECFKTVLVQKIYLLAVTAHSSLEKKNKNKQLLAEKVRRETKFTHTGFPKKRRL